MYYGSLYHGDIIAAFTRNVPGCYVRDYRDSGGFIVIARNYKSIPWRDQTTTCKVERSVPAITLMNLPRGHITRRTIFQGLRLHRPGWLQEFARAGSNLSDAQKRRITKDLRVHEVFEGVVV